MERKKIHENASMNKWIHNKLYKGPSGNFHIVKEFHIYFRKYHKEGLQIITTLLHLVEQQWKTPLIINGNKTGLK